MARVERRGVHIEHKLRLHFSHVVNLFLGCIMLYMMFSVIHELQWLGGCKTVLVGRKTVLASCKTVLVKH